MPYFKAVSSAPLNEEQRKELVDELRSQLNDEEPESRPIIFEMPLEGSNKIDVIVVWDSLNNIPYEERDLIVREAYGDTAQQIAQVSGLTCQEAIEQHWLPYAVRPLLRKDELKDKADKVRREMLEAGGIPLPDGHVDLRFPTMKMAEEAHRKLVDMDAKAYWTLMTEIPPAGEYPF